VQFAGFGWALEHSFLPFISIFHYTWIFITFFSSYHSNAAIVSKIEGLFPLFAGHKNFEAINSNYPSQGNGFS
jgi:hypothetical protein